MPSLIYFTGLGKSLLAGRSEIGQFTLQL